MGTTYPGGIEDCDRFGELVNLFEAEEQRGYYYTLALETVTDELERDDWYRSDDLVYGGLMLLLYTWNFAARKTKTMDGDEIKSTLEEHKDAFEAVQDRELVETDLSDESITAEVLREVWPELREHFGQTGTSKALSLLSPDLFMIWDEEIRGRRRRSQDDPPGTKRPDRGVYFYMKEDGYDLENNSMAFGQSVDDYLAFLRYCQEILADIGTCPVTTKREETPDAKLLDEAFYAFYKLENGPGE